MPHFLPISQVFSSKTPLLAGLALAALAGCDLADLASGEPVPYLVTGLVTDAEGNPVEGADINIHNALNGVGDVRTKTGPDGRYEASVPEGSWIAEAHRTVTYHGAQYCRTALPSSVEPIWAYDGAVRDFVFVTEGENPRGGEPYGGELELTPWLGEGLEHGSTQTLIVTLTPDGPLIDGSAGETLSGPIEIRYESFSTNSFNLYDIPFGRYRVSAAWQQPGGGQRPLRVKNLSSEIPSYGTDVIQFDGGSMGCGSKYYSLVELSVE